MLKEELKKIVRDERQKGTPNFVIKNIVKEYLQFPVLSFIYNSKEYRNMIFTGGSCLRICFDFPRLSEDLDFDLNTDDWKKFDVEKMAKEIKQYFQKNFLLEVKFKTQSDCRIYLKFPILKELELANDSESDFLYVKIEPNETSFLNAKTEIQPISKFGYNFIVQRYTLSYLFTGKLKVIFLRQWFSGEENAIDIKGRDFYDLYWYLEKGIEPEYSELQESVRIKNKGMLNEKLKKRIEKDVTTEKLLHDLRNFFPEQNFIENFCRNYKEIIFGLIK